MKTGKLITEYDNCGEAAEWESAMWSIDSVVKRNSHQGWHATVNNFGWRRLNGTKDFRAGTAADLMGAILPNCSCSGTVYRYGRNGLAVNNYHHDSPSGDEWYYVVPRRQRG